MSIIDFFLRKIGDPLKDSVGDRNGPASERLPPEKQKLYGAYFKKVDGSDLYTLFGDDRWSFELGFPVERRKGKKLADKQEKASGDFRPQMVVSRMKPKE